MSAEVGRILVTGALGQIGTELTAALRAEHGGDSVVATDIRDAPAELREGGPYATLDVTDPNAIDELIGRYSIDTIYHMAAILSAVGEKKPDLCWSVNVGGLKNVLDCAARRQLTRVFLPSSIAVFGAGVPRENTPNDVGLRPTTMYGISKVAGELLGEYYVSRFGLDCRGVRYPGIISHEAPPGGGTTDYAVAIYYEAVRRGSYECFVREDTRLPMMYMPDAIKATLDIMSAPFERLRRHCDYNVAALSFSAGELAESVRRFLPDFTCTYDPDFRQEIADTWPASLDDRCAREDWGWEPAYDLDSMTEEMLEALTNKHEAGLLP